MKIEKDVPIPPTTRGQGLFYPWDKMEVGDSVFIEVEQGHNTRNRIYMSARGYGERHGMTFIVRSTTGGYRVWRES